MGVSKNNGTPKSSILIGFSTINHPFWGGFPLFLETPKCFLAFDLGLLMAIMAMGRTALNIQRCNVAAQETQN